MEFIFITLAALAVMIGVLLLIGRFHPGSAADLIDWKPTRSPEVEVQNELDDVQQMIDAQNAMRRRRGAPEITEEQLRAEVAEEERIRMREGDPFDPS